MASYEQTHPWITFSINLAKAPAKLWVMLGECKTLCTTIASAPLKPDFREELLERYFSLSTIDTTAFEGNALTPDEVRRILFGGLEVPPSRRYLAQENENMLAGYELIMRHLSEYSASPLGTVTLRELNRIVLDRLVVDPGLDPGGFRTGAVDIPSHRFELAPAGEVELLVDKLCEWLTSKTFNAPQGMDIVYGIIKAILANLYLTWIFPFARGNNRTIHLVTFMLLVESGVPPIAAHHFSRLYLTTRYDYYRHIETASAAKPNVVPFIMYSVQGFLDGLNEQLAVIHEHQKQIVWENHVNALFRDKTSLADLRRKHLVLDLSRFDDPVATSAIPEVSTRLARYYASKTKKTLTRDIADLVRTGLLKKTADGVMARRESVTNPLPVRGAAARI